MSELLLQCFLPSATDQSILSHLVLLPVASHFYISLSGNLSSSFEAELELTCTVQSCPEADCLFLVPYCLWCPPVNCTVHCYSGAFMCIH